jgi:hypothetical protein
LVSQLSPESFQALYQGFRTAGLDENDQPNQLFEPGLGYRSIIGDAYFVGKQAAQCLSIG